jgi:hypothetical protein
MGLIVPITKVGRMNVFDLEKTIAIVEKIGDLKMKGKTLKDIKCKK